MTDKTHEITPPPELVQQWRNAAPPLGLNRESWIATQAARWGADQELAACINYFHEYDASWGENSELMTGLRAARRPKPPSLKELALQALERVPGPGADPAYLRTWADREGASLVGTIRRALEAMPND